MKEAMEFLFSLALKGVKLSVDGDKLSCYAQEGLLTEEIKKGIVQHKAHLIHLLKARATLQASAPLERPEFPLSVAQKGLYVLQQLSPDLTAYNVPICFKTTNPIDMPTLRRAWSCVLDQFPILTARIVEKIDGLHHCLDERCRTPVREQRIGSADEVEVIRTLREAVNERFDLKAGPLTRIVLYRRDANEVYLLLTVHHIIFDGTSAVILMRSLLQFYQQLTAGLPVTLATDLLGYQNFVEWEDAMLNSPEGEAHAQYWQRQLNGALPVFELPLEQPRSTSRFEARTLTSTLPARLAYWVHGCSKIHSVPLSVIFLSAFQLLLHKYSGEDDTLVTMPVMGRAAGKFENDVGYFVNMVPLRSRSFENISFGDFLRSVHSTMLEGLFHSSYPFPMILNGIESRGTHRNASFEVSYAYQDLLRAVAPPASGVVTVTEIGQDAVSNLELEIVEDGSSFQLHLKYNQSVYSDATARQLFEHYIALLEGIGESPAGIVGSYSLVPNVEKHRLLVDFNATHAEYPHDKCIHELFAEQVLLNPERVAAVMGAQSLSYRELYERSHDLALYLQAHGVAPDSVVGLCAERSLEMLVAIMGIELAGGAYMPLDPDYPQDRLGYMLRDSSATVVLTQEKFKEKMAVLAGSALAVVCLDTRWSEIAESAAALEARHVELRRDVRSQHLSYVIYTSGSTGKPKGVMVEHRALVNRIIWMQTSYPLTPSDVVLQKTPYSFDVSVWEFFWPLMSGASIVFALPGGHIDVNYLERTIIESGVTTLHFVPSMLATYLEHAAKPCPQVRRVFCSGEALDRKSAERYRIQFVNAALYNLYGPTEAAIDVTAYDCAQLKYPFVPIGAPIANTQIYILDRYDNPQPIGMPGELHIAGDGLARGYLNRPDLTEQRFVANPFAAGKRMYKTGDLARWLDDGNIEYLGRIDTQVKIRGFRIELGEIESRLAQHPGVVECLVVAQGRDAQKQLVAFYRARGSTAEQIVQLQIADLRSFLRQALPDYMTPVAFVSLAAIPLTSSGKADRRALERMDVNFASNRQYVAPRSGMEMQLAAIFAQVLKVQPEKIGVNDNFFEMGGHSLLATQVISKVRLVFDVDLPLKALFEDGTVGAMVEVITALRDSNQAPSARRAVQIRPIERTRFERLPLSFAQERLWFINELEPNGIGYNCPAAVTFSGALDIEQLEEAFRRVIARHESLRTVFLSEEGRAHQVILERVNFRLQRLDVSELDVTKRDTEARRLCQAESALPFDLTMGPLIRGKVIKVSSGVHILMLNMHHIVSDGWSLGVFVKELSFHLRGLSRGEATALPALPIQYVDYSIWQRNRLEEDGILNRQLDYWKTKLAGIIETLDVATDYPRPAERSFEGRSKAFSLNQPLTVALKNLAQSHGCTLYMVLLAAFKVLLHRYTGQQDICVGSPIANRHYGETEDLIGVFVNTLALRNLVQGEDTFVNLLAQVKRTCLDGYENQDAPFEKVVEAVQTQRSLATSPIFQVMFVLQNTDMGTPEHSIQPYPLDNGSSKFDLSLELAEAGEGLAATIEYSTALYKSQTIDRMAEHFTSLCRALTATPAVPIKDLNFLDRTETRRLLHDFNSTKAEYPKARCIHELFADQVRRNPDRTAVVFGELKLSYQELHDRSHDLALYLQAQGVAPDTVVGLCTERSLDMIVGVLGILQAGAAYLPLDPDYPSERLAYMLEDSGAAIVLTQSSLLQRLGSFGAKTLSIALDEPWPIPAVHDAASTQQPHLRRDVGPRNLAYVIYTSGSTGRPKAVMVEHQSLVNHNTYARKQYGITERDIQIQFSSMSFDLFIEEVFSILAAGARLIVEQKDNLLTLQRLEETLVSRKITVLNVPTSFFHHVAATNLRLAGVEKVIVGGEKLSYARAREFIDKNPGVRLHNTYGPTETTIISTAVPVTAELVATHRSIPIGAPIANTQIHILDTYGNLQPIGVAGEICIAGDGLARGYLNRPDLTEQRFVSNPFNAGTRMYRTGDLARWLEDGNIEYLGRIDTQVKIRGFRIEPAEIESRLNEHDDILDGIVVVQGADAERQLVAFYRASGSTADHLVTLPADGLRSHLRHTLPEHMVPAAFVSLAALPLTPNGKTDRRALERLDVNFESNRQYVAPRSGTEMKLAAIFAQVLKIQAQKIGVNDNFFEMGGHSLLATQVISKVRQVFYLDLPLKSLFDEGTVGAIADMITAMSVTDEGSVEVEADELEEVSL